MSISHRRFSRTAEHTSNKIVAVYYPGYSRSSTGVGNTSIANLNWNSFSHIIDFSVGLDNGRLSDRWIPDGATAYGDNGWNAAQATALCSAAAARGKKVLLCLGSSETSESWNTNLDTPAKRTQIITDICNYMTTYGYNGIDLDGEPSDAVTNYRIFWQEIIAAFAARGWRTPGSATYRTVSAALYGSSTALAKQANADGLDWVAPMLYIPWQLTSRHLSPLTGPGDPWDTYITAWSTGANAVPKAKILPGMSYYVYSWDDTTGPNQTSSAINAGLNWSVVNTAIGGINAPNASWYSPAIMHGMTIGGAWHSFESAASIQAKANWIQANGCGGTIIWMYQHGSLGGTSHPLASSVQTNFGPL